MMEDYHILSRSQYFTTLAKLVSSAKRGERVMVATMDISPEEPLVALLLESLRLAARRGANVTLFVDAHNFLIDTRVMPGPLFFRANLRHVSGLYAATINELEKLKSSGGEYCITNIPKRRFTLPVAGRSHIKAAVVGDTLFVGGCNLVRAAETDVMVQLRDKKAADTVAIWLRRIASEGVVRDAFGDVDSQRALNKTMSLLLDAGVPRQSLIYEEALRIINDAEKELLITCQYFPGGQTAQHLAAAQARGVQVTIYYGHPRSQGPIAPVHHLHQLAQHARRLPSNFYAGRLDKHAPKLHAKILLNEKTSLIGSHNYVEQGVQFGTAELALEVEDPAFVATLKRYIQKELDIAHKE